MKIYKRIFLVLFVVFGWCNAQEAKIKETFLDRVADQYEYLYHNSIKFLDTNKPMPRTIVNGELHSVSIYDWTSGFHPGSMWNLYKLTNNTEWKNRALYYTKLLDSLQYYTETHDLGFMIGDSYGNALKYIDNQDYEKVMVQASKSLSSRFKPKAEILQSWNTNDRWQCPVIIDNMMNLEMLFEATKISGDSTYYNIAITHANTTMRNHFRDDFSSFHVLDYDIDTGNILKRNTAQGYKDESAWARGQAWGLYGFVVMYRETKDIKYLELANNIANYINNHKNLPEDKIPYWDYDAPVSNNTPRDASAAAITASALYELSTFVDDSLKTSYVNRASNILKSLSTETYLAEVGTNEGFLLKHSTGHLPDNSEIDVPINYADYYFLEALLRQHNLKTEN